MQIQNEQIDFIYDHVFEPSSSINHIYSLTKPYTSAYYSIMTVIRFARANARQSAKDRRSAVMTRCWKAVGEFFAQRSSVLTNPDFHSQIEREYFNYQPARILSAFRALPEEAPIAGVLALASNLQPVAPKPQPIWWHWKRKRNGGRRVICDLPPEHKAVHYMMMDLLHNFSRLPEFIYNAPGKGTKDAISRAKKALEEGYQHCLIGDVQNCFPSISTERLNTLLPLTSDLVENNLDVGRLSFRQANRGYVPNGSAGGANPSGPRGLLQGSPASNMVLAVLLQGVGGIVAHLDIVLCLYADNLLVAAKSQAELEAATALIQAYLGEHPAGPLDLHEVRRTGPCERLEYLGYEFQALEDGSVSASPSHSAHENILKRMWAATLKDVDRADGLSKELQAVYRATASSNRAATSEFHRDLYATFEAMLENITHAYALRLGSNGGQWPYLGDGPR